MKGGDLNVVISIEYDDNQLVRRIKKDFRFNVLKSKKETILKQINQTNKQRKKKKIMNNNKKEKKKKINTTTIIIIIIIIIIKKEN